MISLDDIVQRWRRFWNSLGNVPRSGDYLPQKSESLAPIPTAQEWLISSDDSTEDREIYSPLKSGKIRGTVNIESALTITGPITNAARTQIIPAGTVGHIVSIRNTSGAQPAAITLLTADAAPAVGNTIAVSPTIPAGGERSFLYNATAGDPSTMVITDLYGPVYGVMDANAATYVIWVTKSQVAMA